MIEPIRGIFGLYFIVWGLLIIFALPADIPARFINYVILGVYGVAILWWAFQGWPWWVAYWVSAFAITSVVTFGTLHK